MNPRPLPPQGSALPTAPHPDEFIGGIAECSTNNTITALNDIYCNIIFLICQVVLEYFLFLTKSAYIIIKMIPAARETEEIVRKLSTALYIAVVYAV